MQLAVMYIHPASFKGKVNVCRNKLKFEDSRHKPKQDIAKRNHPQEALESGSLPVFLAPSALCTTLQLQLGDLASARHRRATRTLPKNTFRRGDSFLLFLGSTTRLCPDSDFKAGCEVQIPPVHVHNSYQPCTSCTYAGGHNGSHAAFGFSNMPSGRGCVGEAVLMELSG